MNYYAMLAVLVVVTVAIIGILVFGESFRNTLHNPHPFMSVWSPKDKKVVMRTLYDAMRILGSHEIEMVAMFGTLIGALRHQGLIPWDDDMDFAIRRDQKELLFSLKEELANANIGIVETWAGDLAKLYPLDRPQIGKYPWSWPFIDIFYYHEDGEDIVLNRRSDSQSKISKNDFLPFKKGIFEGFYVNIPNNSDKILMDRYGNEWKNVCVSSDYNHRLEVGQEGGHRARCSDVSLLGSLKPLRM